MADKKISELDDKATPIGADYVALVDSEETPDVTKRATVANLRKAINLATDPTWAAKGDIAVASANDTGGVLGVGSTGQLLTVTSATPAWTSIGVMMVAATDATAAEKAQALASGGAVCDGASDETEIIAAIAANRRVILSSGTFVIDGTIEKAVDNIILEGQGKTLTTIQLKTTINLTMLATGGQSYWEIRNILFDGNKANNVTATNKAIQLDGLHFVVENCEIKNVMHSGIDIRRNSDDITIRDCYIHDTGSAVYAWTSNTYQGASNVLVDHCHLAAADEESTVNIYGYDATYKHKNWLVTNCLIDGTTGYIGVMAAYADNVTVSNNVFDVSSATGGNNPACIRFYHYTTGIISGNTFWGAGAGAPSDGYSCISIYGTENVTISDNHFFTISPREGAAINISATTTVPSVKNIIVTGNTFYNIGILGEWHIINLTAADTYTITDVLISNNIFLDDRGASAICEQAILCMGAGVITNIVITDNYIEGILLGFLLQGSTGAGTGNNIVVKNNHIYDVPTGVHFNDGDDVEIVGNTFRSCTTPIDIDDADVVRALVMGNNWYGCTNDIVSTNAVTPRIFANIDKTGVWAYGTVAGAATGFVDDTAGGTNGSMAPVSSNVLYDHAALTTTAHGISGYMPLAGGALSGIITTTEHAAIQLQPTLATDHHWNGITRSCTCSTTAHIAIGEVAYMNAAGTFDQAKGDAYATTAGQLVLATTAADHDGTTTFIGLLYGYFYDATFDLTIGGEVWISKATLGLITKTQPTTPAFLRCIGYGDDDVDTIFFNPSAPVVEI